MASSASSEILDLVNYFDALKDSVNKQPENLEKGLSAISSKNPFLDSDGNVRKGESFILDYPAPQSLRFDLLESEPNSTSLAPAFALDHQPLDRDLKKIPNATDREKIPRSFIKSTAEQSGASRKKTSRSSVNAMLAAHRPAHSRMGKWLGGLVNGDTDASYSQAYRHMLRLAEELRAAKRKVRQVTEANNSTRRRKEELESDLTSAHKKLSELAASSTLRLDEHSQVFSELKFAKRRIADAEREAAQAIGRACKFEKDLLESEKKKKAYLAELSSANLEISRLQRRVQDLEEELREIVQDHKKCKLQELDKETEMEDLRRENRDLRGEYITKMSEYSELRKSVELLVGEKKSAFAKPLNDRSDLDNVLKRELELVQGKYSLSEAAVKSGKEQVTRLHEEVEKLQSAKQEVEEDLRRVTVLLDRSKHEKEEFSKKLELANKKLYETQSERDQARHGVELLRQENNTLKDKLSYLNLYKQLTETQKQKQSQENEHRNRSYDELTENTRLLREQNERLLQEVERIKNKPFTVELPVSSPTENITNVSTELRELSRKLDELRYEQQNMHEQIDFVRKISSPLPKSNLQFLTLERSESLHSVHSELPSLIIPDRSGRNSPVLFSASGNLSPTHTIKQPFDRATTKEDSLYSSNRDISFTTHIPAVNKEKKRKKVVNLDLSAESVDSQMTTEL